MKFFIFSVFLSLLFAATRGAYFNDRPSFSVAHRQWAWRAHVHSLERKISNISENFKINWTIICPTEIQLNQHWMFYGFCGDKSLAPILYNVKNATVMCTYLKFIVGAAWRSWLYNSGLNVTARYIDVDIAGGSLSNEIVLFDLSSFYEHFTYRRAFHEQHTFVSNNTVAHSHWNYMHINNGS